MDFHIRQPGFRRPAVVQHVMHSHGTTSRGVFAAGEGNPRAGAGTRHQRKALRLPFGAHVAGGSGGASPGWADAHSFGPPLRIPSPPAPPPPPPPPRGPSRPKVPTGAGGASARKAGSRGPPAPPAPPP